MNSFEERGLVRFDQSSGFSLALFDELGNEVDHIILMASNARCLSRRDTILLSASRTLAEMWRFSRTEKDLVHFRAHLHDFERKAEDLLAEIAQE